ncbi:MAG: O-antigen ligase family protein [Bacteroidetes bacterium]|nr:O-antigen ligase family protein [Bacteroidota bacterium]HET6244972.1 O-antigen ligase family protein [Bacteroidia bacterium]
MISPKFNEKTHLFLTGLLAFLIPANPYIVVPVVILLAINWLSNPKLIIQGFKHNIQNIPLLMMVLFFVLYLIGMLYSDNLQFGFETIETKLSFLAFPLIFSPYSNTFKNNMNRYLKFFIYGCAVNAFACFAWAAYRFLKPVYVDLYGVPYDLGASYFYYEQLSVFFHPSYIAMYSVFALAALFHLVNTNALKLNWNWYALIVLLIVFILLLSSKAGWIGLLLFLVYFSRNLLKKKGIKHVVLMFGFLIGLFFTLNIYFTPLFTVRIPQLSVITDALKGRNSENEIVKTSTDGTGSRILVWKAAIEIIKNNFWIGVGTGDAKDKMLEKYKEMEMTTEYEHKLNSHNQYLNTFIALGIFGFSVLILCFIFPFYFSYKNQFILYGAFIIFVAVNFLFESMLERQAGVIFFTFFNSIFIFSLNQSNNDPILASKN